MTPLHVITALHIPPDLLAAHCAAAPDISLLGSSIEVYSLPPHPLTDAIGVAIGIHGEGVACDFAQLHADIQREWDGARFVSVVVTGYHYINAVPTRRGDGNPCAIVATPGVVFQLRPQSWHCAIRVSRDAPPLRLAQWIVPMARMGSAMTAMREIAGMAP